MAGVRQTKRWGEGAGIAVALTDARTGDDGGGDRWPPGDFVLVMDRLAQLEAWTDRLERANAAQAAEINELRGELDRQRVEADRRAAVVRSMAETFAQLATEAADLAERNS